MKRLIRPLCTIALLLLAVSQVDAAPEFSIRTVTGRRIRPRADRFLDLTGSTNNLGMFEDAVRSTEGEIEGEEFTVVWNYSGNLPVRRVEVLFEFRQERSREPRKLRIAYRAVGGGSAESIFRITGDAYREGGNVQAWKVSLIADGAVVDTAESWSWNQP